MDNKDLFCPWFVCVFLWIPTKQFNGMKTLLTMLMLYEQPVTGILNKIYQVLLMMDFQALVIKCVVANFTKKTVQVIIFTVNYALAVIY